MEQQIRFCTTSDGVRIAYASVGEGPPVVYANGWPTHLEMEWESPSSRSFLEAMAEGCTLIRYDMRGTGLSDRDVSEFPLDVLVRDLEAVVDHLELDRFDLVSLGVLAGPIAMTYAAANQGRVARLVLSTAFLRGDKITTPDRQRALIDYAAQFGMPSIDFIDGADADIGAIRDAQRRLQETASSAVQSALLRTLFSVDVSGLAERLTMPTLVLHGRQDTAVPFSRGRDLAARLPQVRFVPFEGQSSAPWAYRNVMVPEIHRFLGLEATVPEPQRAPPAAVHTILFTDMEGSTALTQRLGDAKAREVLRDHERIVRECLKAHGGSEVKTLGDGFMASFGSARQAVECAIAIQRAFAEQNAALPAHPEALEGGAEPQPSAHASRASRPGESPPATARADRSVDAEPVRVRIGLNAGEPIAEDDPDGRGDLFGTVVNMAARIAAAAAGGEILASNVVRELVSGKGFLFNDRGETELRGFEDPVRVYEVLWQSQQEGQA